MEIRNTIYTKRVKYTPIYTPYTLWIMATAIEYTQYTHIFGTAHTFPRFEIRLCPFHNLYIHVIHIG